MKYHTIELANFSLSWMSAFTGGLPPATPCVGLGPKGPATFPAFRWRTLQGVLIWVNYNELTTSSLEIIVSKGNHPLLWP